jgi:hypothetical protein
MKTKNLSLASWSIVGVPVIFAGYVEWSYQYSLSRSGLPFNILPQWLWFVIFGICIISGAIAVGALPFKNNRVRIALIVSYLVVMIIMLASIHIYVACINEDCL